MAESAQHVVMQAATLVDSAFFEHWKGLIEQTRCTGAQFANDLNASICHREARNHRKTAMALSFRRINLLRIRRPV